MVAIVWLFVFVQSWFGLDGIGHGMAWHVLLWCELIVLAIVDVDECGVSLAGWRMRRKWKEDETAHFCPSLPPFFSILPFSNFVSLPTFLFSHSSPINRRRMGHGWNGSNYETINNGYSREAELWHEMRWDEMGWDEVDFFWFYRLFSSLSLKI